VTSTSFHTVQAVTAEMRHDAVDVDSALIELTALSAEEFGAVEVDKDSATIDWHEVTDLNRLALEMQVRQLLQVGDWVAHITLPCRREDPPARPAWDPEPDPGPPPLGPGEG
jgi:hypothetical protein